MKNIFKLLTIIFSLFILFSLVSCNNDTEVENENINIVENESKEIENNNESKEIENNNEEKEINDDSNKDEQSVIEDSTEKKEEEKLTVVDDFDEADSWKGHLF